MNHAAIFLLTCCLPVVSSAEVPESIPTFGYVGAAQLLQVKTEARPVAARALDVIMRDNLLLQAGRAVLVGYAKTDAEFREAVAYWTPVLSAAGITVGAASFANGMYEIPYAAPGGKVVRSFLAEPRQFPPKDDAGLRANMALAQNALAKAGLPVVSARVVNVDFHLPTYSLLYLASAEDVPEREKLLRVLKPGGEIDFDLIRNAGVIIVQQPQDWLMVYIGPQLGAVGLVAHDRGELDKKLQARKDELIQQGKRIIGEKILPLDDPDWKFGARLYFFQ